jgi:hypothetical protein
MRTRKAIIFASFPLLLAALPALAHHSFSAEFDTANPFKLTGTVTKVEWTNPHVWFFLDVKGEDGKVENWGLEMGPPNTIMRAGWNRNTMKVGDVVRVEGSRARDASNHGYASVVIMNSTGQRLLDYQFTPDGGVSRATPKE